MVRKIIKTEKYDDIQTSSTTAQSTANNISSNSEENVKRKDKTNLNATNYNIPINKNTKGVDLNKGQEINIKNEEKDKKRILFLEKENEELKKKLNILEKNIKEIEIQFNEAKNINNKLNKRIKELENIISNTNENNYKILKLENEINKYKSYFLFRRRINYPKIYFNRSSY